MVQEHRELNSFWEFARAFDTRPTQGEEGRRERGKQGMQGACAVRTVILLTGVVSARSFTLPLRQLFSAGRVLERQGASAACMSSAAPQPFRVGVVGAGIAGCTLARRLKDAGANVTVFEMGRGAGGRMATRKTRDFPVSWPRGSPFPRLKFLIS